MLRARSDPGRRLLLRLVGARANGLSARSRCGPRSAPAAADNIAGMGLLREVTSTVGSRDQIGEPIRRSFSVSMPLEGWDGDTVMQCSA